MAKRAGQVVINLSAGTAKFLTDMERAKGKVIEFGSAGKTAGGHVTGGMAAASASVRLFEGTLSIRAVERFLSETLKLGPVLTNAFPVIGATVFAGVLIETGEKVYKFIKDIQQMPEKLTGAFRELNAPLRTTNDELRVTNDRLANDIAKLEHRPQNTLKLALDEATAAADKLADSLDRDLAALSKLIREQKQSFFKDIVSGQAGVDDIEKELGGETGFGGFRAAVAGVRDPKQLAAMYEAEIAKLQGWLENAKGVERANDAAKIRMSQRKPGTVLSASDVPGESQGNRIEFLGGSIRDLTSQREGIGLSGESAKLKAAKEKLEGTKSLNEEEQRELKAGYDRMLADAEAFDVMLASEKLAFRQNELAEISQYGDKYKSLRHELMVEIGHLEQEDLKAGKEARDKDQKDQVRYLEEMSHLAVEWKKRTYDSIAAMRKSLTGERSTEPRPDIEQTKIEGDFRTQLAGTPLGNVLKIREAGYRTVSEQQQDLAQQRALLDLMQQGNYTLAQRLEVQDKILRIQSQQSLEERTLSGGMKAFLIDMQQSAMSAGEILYRGLHNGLDRFSDSLADVLTGKSGNWGAAMQEVGRGMVRDTVRSLTQQAIAKLTGKDLALDGQSATKAKWVRIADVSGPVTAKPSAIGGGILGRMGSIFSGNQGGGMIFNLGEPSMSPGGGVAMQMNGGGGNTYYVDARGADEQRVYRAMMAAHESSVATSVQASVERWKRTPGGM